MDGLIPAGMKVGDLVMGLAIVGVLLMLLICGDWGDDDGPDGTV